MSADNGPLSMSKTRKRISIQQRWQNDFEHGNSNLATIQTCVTDSEQDLLLAARSISEGCERVRGGSSVALGLLLDLHSPRVMRTILSIAATKEDAEDVLQDARLRAFVHLAQFNGHSKFSTWFTRIAINAALMMRRKNRVARTMSATLDDLRVVNNSLDFPDPGPDAETILLTKQRKAFLTKTMSQIRPVLRNAIELRYLRDNSLAEVAGQLDISVAAVKGRLFHAKAELKRKMLKKTASV
jgi:RNA polymerase sigma-70 factor (ECF subfamily)